MKRPIAHVALLLAAMLAASQAAARVVSLDLDAGPPSESSIAALRSAFYLRSAALDQAEPSATAEQRQLRIQRHFDLVLAGLVANADRSLDMALARLELDRGQNWTAADRDAWRQKLAERRYANIRRLRAYQLRGLFPQNEHVADRAVPVFVDNYDTACAVGHLMRESGWGAAVDAIQDANNLVYVIDVHHGVLVDWVLISGLTQEEAALIQPAYDPATFDRTVDQLVNGGSITKDGLTYSNFELSGIDLFDDFELNRVDLSRVGVAVWKACFPQMLGRDLARASGTDCF